MRSMEITGSTFDSVLLVERPVPAPAAGEVQVRMTAATLNYRDLLMVTGSSASGRKDNCVPLSCGCGVVSAVGPGAARFKVGERVMPTFFQDWISGPRTAPGMGLSLGGSVDGVARDYGCYPQDYLVKVPDMLGDLEAATLPCAALTVWNALFVARATRPGDVVLLQGTGGVSIAGLQLAKAAGATVIITSSSHAKLERARAMGADYLINYREVPAWGLRARQITGDRGVDVVLEVGGQETLQQSVQAMAPGGTIAAIGLLGGTRIGRDAAPGVVGIRVGSRAMFEDMNRAIAANGIRPVVDRVYPLEKLPQAMAALKAGEIFGKVAVQMA
jgi:NADPH:quinone reductase-like Zn-dependent oxidoreductase